MSAADRTSPPNRDTPRTELAEERGEATLDQPSEQSKSEGQSTLQQGDGESRAPDPNASTAGRYRILRAHARGGLGEVFIAEDTELGRQVALKEILPLADHSVNRARFVLEAEITGGLEHPGIVPVYGLGQYADGRPFYAMRFIAGESFRKAIQRFHEKERQFASLEFRALLGRFVAVCQAVAFAHARGVLHRDLKPDNVMLGKYGETLVVDWGLAKSTGQTDLAAEGEVALQPRSATDSSATIVGQTLGTPAYMAPEQANGQLDELGPAADIYSLGATLFELLTGRVAFQGKFLQIVLEDVIAGRFPPPRRLVASIPPELNAICLKAMALKPADRYPTAQELAADIEHWLADEPVSAFREPLSTRMWRWVRRHRTLVSSAAALLLTAAVGLAVGVVLVSREQTRTAHERDEKEIARLRAEQNEKKAIAARNAEAAARRRTRAALNTMTDDVIEKLLAKQATLGDNEKRFLGRVQKFYEEFAAAGGDSQEAKANQLDGLFRLANIHVRLGHTNEAEKAYRDAFALSTQLVAASPAVVEYRSHLADIRSNLANFLSERGQRPEAEVHLKGALTTLTQLAADHSKAPEYRAALARTHTNYGVLLRELKRPAETEAAYKAALEIRAQLVAEHPGNADYRQDAARSRSILGALYTELKRPDEATAYYRAALTDQNQLADQFPANPAYRQDLGATHNNLGNLLTSQRKLDEAEAAFRAALAVKSKLAADFPSMPEYRRDLAVSQTNFAIVLRDLRKTAEAESTLKEAISLRARLAADFPSSPAYRKELARTHASLGALLKDLNRAKEAEESLRAALALRVKLADEDSQNPDAAVDAARTHFNLALMKRAENDIPEYRRLLEAALPRLKSAVALAPKNKSYRDFYHLGLESLAPLLLVQGDHAGAASLTEEWIRLNIKPVEDAIAAAGILSSCAAFAAEDKTLPEPRRAELVGDYAMRAVQLLRKAMPAAAAKVQAAMKSPDFDPIRLRAEFNDLLWELADG